MFATHTHTMLCQNILNEVQSIVIDHSISNLRNVTTVLSSQSMFKIIADKLLGVVPEDLRLYRFTVLQYASK